MKGDTRTTDSRSLNHTPSAKEVKSPRCPVGEETEKNEAKVEVIAKEEKKVDQIS